MAEGEGFEPPLPFRVKRFSRPPVSTTHTSLRVRVYQQFISIENCHAWPLQRPLQGLCFSTSAFPLGMYSEFLQTYIQKNKDGVTQADTLICLGYSGMRRGSESPGQPHVRKLLLKQALSVFLSAFSSVLRIVPKAVFRVRSTAVLAIFSVAVSSLAAHAQTSEWTWMGGSSIFTEQSNGEPGQPGMYGTQGQPSAANVPGGRLGAVSWTDKDGNFWLFGGAGLDSTETFGFLNDLWEFDPSTGEWRWFREAIR